MQPLFSIIQKSHENEYIYENKSIINTLKHAEQDAICAEFLLSKANECNDNNSKNYSATCDQATKLAIDSTEKYGKVLLHMNNCTDKTLIKTHNITKINNSTSFLSLEDAKFMDSFTDNENDCYNSHTGLSYGDTSTTYEDAKKAVGIMTNAKNYVNDFREKVKTKQLYDSIILK